MDTEDYSKEIEINGKKIKIENLKDGKINGLVKITDEENNKIYEVNMEDNKLVGNMRLENKDKTINIKNFHKMEGIVISKLKNRKEEKITSIEELKNGKINGEVIIKELKDNIDLVDAFFGNFVEGILTGLFKKNNEEENIIGNFKDNKKEGIFEIVKTKTNELWKINFINNKPDGKITLEKNPINMPPDNLIKVIEKSKFKKILDTIIKAIKKFLNIIKNIILLPFNICGKFIMKILKFIKNIFKFFK
jgi:hypothetical protein